MSQFRRSLQIDIKLKYNIFKQVIYRTIYQMRKQLRQKLRSQSSVQLAESIAYVVNNDQSLIQQLNDLLQQENIPDASERLSFPLRNGYAYNNSVKHLHNRNTINIGSDLDTLQSHRSRNKLNFNRKNDKQLQFQLLSQNIRNLHPQQRKTSFKQNLILQVNKQDNSVLKIKYEYNKSQLIRNKNFIQNNLLSKCQYCNSSKSEIFRSNLICSNRKCNQINFLQKIDSFPILGVLYQIQNPSSSVEELQQVIKKIEEQIKKIQNWRQSLIQVQFQLSTIIQKRNQLQKINKNSLKQVLNLINQSKLKKGRQIQEFIIKCRAKFKDIKINMLHQQFSIWNRIKDYNFQQNKSIAQKLKRYMPLCMKHVSSELIEQIASTSNNFNSSTINLNAGQNLLYNFSGNLQKMVLHIDGAIKLKRDNFILVQSLKYLQLVFQNRKTSRQLRQFFNILPKSSVLVSHFDFKSHSHVSSQTFPILTKLCEIPQFQIYISLLNARPQVFQDLVQAVKVIKNKQVFNLSIKINEYIAESQWPQYSKSKQWGTKLVINLIKNLGKKIKKICLELPIHIKIQQIYEYILNSQYSMLIELKIKTLNSQLNAQSQFQVGKLLKKIVNKRVLLLGLLTNQKKYLSHPLNKDYRLTQSVYNVLF